MQTIIIIILVIFLIGFWLINSMKEYKLGTIVDMGYNENAPMERTFFMDVKFGENIYLINVSKEVYYNSRVGQNFAILI